MQRYVAPDSLPVVICIAVQAAMAAGIVSTDVCSGQTGTLLPGSLLFRHGQPTAQGIFQNLLREAAIRVNVRTDEPENMTDHII